MTTLFLLAQAAQDTAAPAPNVAMQFLPLLFIGVIFYFILIRPQQKRQKEHRELVAAIKTGDSVVTNSGIFGRIANVKEKSVYLTIADNVKIEITKEAIATVLKPSEKSE